METVVTVVITLVVIGVVVYLGAMLLDAISRSFKY